MKKLLFLLLFPCLCVAQYTGNGNQKITLGEQTSADGLVFRGVASIDTVTATSKITRANKQDTSAFLLLDTVTNLLWHYKTTSNGWIQAGGGVSVSSFSAGSTGLTPSTATTGAVTLGGTLAVANGGTGATSISPNNYLIRTNSSGVFDTSAVYEQGGNVGIGFTSPGNKLAISQSVSTVFGNAGVYLGLGSVENAINQTVLIGFGYKEAPNNEYPALIGYLATNNTGQQYGALVFGTRNVDANSAPTERMRIASDGNVGIGTTSPAVQFHTTSNVRFAGLTSITDLRTDADGDLFNGSDFNLKNTIDTINFGLSDVLKLKPVSFTWNDEARNINEYKSMGFIAQDIMDVIPNAASTMGDGDMQVDYNAIVATLTKAIQEQNALIKALEQRILILENK